MRKLLILLLFSSLIVSGCSIEQKKANVKDIIVENVSTTIDIKQNGYYTKIIRTSNELELDLPRMGFSLDTLEVYDSEFFNNRVLLAIIFKTGVSNDVLLEGINLTNKTATVKMNIKIPNNVDDLLSNKGIIIEVDREEFSNVSDIKIDLNSKR